MKSFPAKNWIPVIPSLMVLLPNVVLAASPNPVFFATAPYVVASSATGNANYPPSGQNLLFAIVSTNFGGTSTSKACGSTGYCYTTGVFTAPKAGYYSFSYMMSAAEDGSHYTTDLAFALNGSVQTQATTLWPATSSSGAAWSTISNTWVVKLATMDKVSVMHSCCVGDKQPYAWRANFSGVYIHP